MNQAQVYLAIKAFHLPEWPSPPTTENSDISDVVLYHYIRRMCLRCWDFNPSYRPKIKEIRDALRAGTELSPPPTRPEPTFKLPVSGRRKQGIPEQSHRSGTSLPPHSSPMYQSSRPSQRTLLPISRRGLASRLAATHGEGLSDIGSSQALDGMPELPDESSETKSRSVFGRPFVYPTASSSALPDNDPANTVGVVQLERDQIVSQKRRDSLHSGYFSSSYEPSGRSSRMTYIASENRYQSDAHNHSRSPSGYMIRNNESEQTEIGPEMQEAVDLVKDGDFMFKFTRRRLVGIRGDRWHKRYFWVDPYTRTLYWNSEAPNSRHPTELKAKSGMHTNVPRAVIITNFCDSIY